MPRSGDHERSRGQIALNGPSGTTVKFPLPDTGTPKFAFPADALKSSQEARPCSTIYVNGECRDAGTDLEKLMHDFFCEDPRDMHYPVLAERAKYFKEDEQGMEAMCRAFQEVWDDGRQEGRDEKTRELVEAVLSKGKSPEETAELLNLAVDEVRRIAEQRKAERVTAGA